MKYRIFADRVKLIDSYLISKKKMGRELQSIRNLHPSCPLWQRSEGSLKREWATHNLAYALGIRREKTKDCDLNYSLPWYAEVFYVIVGGIALLIIK